MKMYKTRLKGNFKINNLGTIKAAECHLTEAYNNKRNLKLKLTPLISMHCYKLKFFCLFCFRKQLSYILVIQQDQKHQGQSLLAYQNTISQVPFLHTEFCTVGKCQHSFSIVKCFQKNTDQI